jgi:hypothetical protein
MVSYGIKWENIDYELSLFRNYRNLKNFIKNGADESWQWFPQRFEYLKQIKFFSKQDLAEYYPDQNLDDLLEIFDAPFPVYDKHFFSHLPLQLSFIKFHRIENLLDYHLRSYIKYKPEYENAFLNILEHRVVGVIEHNQINNYNEISIAVLKWIREKREFLELKNSSAKSVNIVYNEFVDISVPIINNWINNSAPPNQTPTTPPSGKPATPKSKSPKQDFKIIIKEGMLDAFTKEIYELVRESEFNLTMFRMKISESLNGKQIIPRYIIGSRQIGTFCKLILKYYEQKKVLSGVQKKDLAQWIVINFAQQKAAVEHSLSYKIVYNHLKGSKK